MMRPRDEIKAAVQQEVKETAYISTSIWPMVELLLDIRDLLKALVANTDWGPGPIQDEAGKLQARREELEALACEREAEIQFAAGNQEAARVILGIAAKTRALGEG